MIPFLAIDPGKKAGFAIFNEKGELAASGDVRGDHPEDASALILSAVSRYGCKLLVIEDQVPHGRRSFKSLRTLIRRSAVWWALWRSRGFPERSVKWVTASQWQSSVLKANNRVDARARDNAAVELCFKKFNLEACGNDESNAICIGIFSSKFLSAKGWKDDELNTG